MPAYNLKVILLALHGEKFMFTLRSSSSSSLLLLLLLLVVVVVVVLKFLIIKEK